MTDDNFNHDSNSDNHEDEDPQPRIQPVGDENLTDSFLGLPDGWNERDIPTGKQIFEATINAYERVKKQLNDDQAIPTEKQLETYSEKIIQASDYPTLLPEVVSYALSRKDKFFGAACLHLWNRLLMNLFFKTTNYDTDKDIQHRMLSQIALELGIVSNIRSNHKGAVARLKQAIDFALNNADDKQWLQANVERFYAICLQISVEEVQSKANELLEIAKMYHDHMTEMRIYTILAHTHNYHGDVYKGFIFGQQALVLACAMKKTSSIVLCLSTIAPYIFQNPRLDSYCDQIIVFWQQAIHTNKSLRLYALYLSQYSPYLYRRKLYDQAYESYRHCIDLYEQMNDRDNLARMVHGLGMTCTQLQKWEEAQANLELALSLYKELHQETNQVWIQHCIGWLNIKRGDLRSGISFLEFAYQDAQVLPLTTQRRTTLMTSIKKDLDNARSELSTILQ